MLSSIFSAGEDGSEFEGIDSVMDPSCVVEKLSASLESCEPFRTVEVELFESLVVAPDSVRTDGIVSALDSVNITESSGQKLEKDTVGSVDVVSEIKCLDTNCSTLQMGNAVASGSLLNTATGRPSRKCKKVSNKNMPGNLDILELARRRRRSCSSKKPRSSDWGSLNNIGHIFKQIADTDLNQIEHKKSRKARSSQRDAKRNNNQRRRSSLRSNKEIPATTSRIRLKVTFGGSCPSNITLGSCPSSITPVVVDNHTSSCDTQIKSPKFTEGIMKKLEEGIPSALGSHDANASQKQVDLLEEAVDNRCSDPGTSPDSEVINLVPESQISEKIAEDDILIKQTCVAPGEVTSSSQPQSCSRKGSKKNKLFQTVNCSMDYKPPSPEVIDNTLSVDEHRHLVRLKNDAFSNEAFMSTTTGNTSAETGSGVFSIESPLPTSGGPDFGNSSKTFKVENGMEGGMCSLMGFQDVIPEKGLPSTKPRDLEDAKYSRSFKSRSEFSKAKSQGGSLGRKKGVLDLKPTQKSDHVSETVSQTLAGHGGSRTGCSITPDATYTKMNAVKDEYVPPRSAWVSCDDCSKWRRIPAALADSIEDTKGKWICKDNVDKDFADCSVPQEKSNAQINAELDISDASCEEDTDSAHQNSSRLEKKKATVAQQSSWKLIRSNHFMHRTRKTQTIDEIMVCYCKAPLGGRMGCGDGCLNRMLNIECVKGTCPCGELCANNQFQKRKYAKLKCFRSGRKGYGLQLLEDIHEGQFLIEYIGEVLDMNAYEDRQKEYALKGHRHFYFMTLNGSEVIDACAKGNLGRFINHSCEPNCRTEKWMVNGEVCIGLFALRDIKKGEEVTFDYNYVRVFGAAAKKCVCGSSLCRGYIGGDPSSGEIIVQDDSDEECLESVVVGEDSDDNLDNIVSASSSADLINMSAAAEGVIGQDADTNKHLEVLKEMQAPFRLSKQSKESDVSTAAAGCMVMSSSIDESMQKASSADPNHQNVVGLSACMQTTETFLQLEDGKGKIISVVPLESSVAEETSNRTLSTEISTEKLGKSLVDNTDNRMKFKDDAKEECSVISASRPLKKTSQLPSLVKKGKPRKSDVLVKCPAEMVNKLHQLPYKSKRLMDGSSSDPFEAVQVKLNELLDAEGGISKRKDASRGYLKLLFLTAAFGDSGNGEAIQSNRDLSMILDGLLKTKSRTVLADIINKNGLQMLHNIMKRCRKEFHKIPILRKLLKVLEYLAARDILTLEHISSGPRCAGVESFRESILSLTEHDDRQVHNIARSFRDKWIPKPMRKNSYMDRDTGRMDFNRGGTNCNRLSEPHSQYVGRRQPDSVDCINQPINTNNVRRDNFDSCSVSCSSGSVANETRVRKRKTRWDQPAETNLDIVTSPHKEPKIHSGSVQASDLGPQHGISSVSFNQDAVIYEGKNSYQSENHSPHQLNTKNLDDDGQYIDEDLPPGFSSPHKGSLLSSSASSTASGLCPEKHFCLGYSCELVLAHPQERFISRLPISFGIPLHLVQQFGRPPVEGAENCIVATGIPFHPYPPLPPYPRASRGPTAASSSFTTHFPPVVDEGFQNRPTYQLDQNTFSTSVAEAPPLELPGPIKQHNFQRRGAFNCLGRKYFRQQKWNNTKPVPPWFRSRPGRGNFGSYLRKGTNSIGLGNGVNELKDPSTSEQEYKGVGSFGNTF